MERKRLPRKTGRNNPKHKYWVQQVTDRDKGYCLSCDSKIYVCVRYILSYKEFPGLAYEPDNGICLCAECYYYLKGGDYEQVCRSLIIDQKFRNNKEKK